jgi:hypothetical protein
VSVPSIPNPWTIDTVLSGGVDTSIAVTALPTIESSMAITQLPTINASIAITQLPTIQSSFAITQLPQINIDVVHLPQIDIQMGIRPTRVHLPTNMKFSVCVFGWEVLSFSTCGESMVIIEDYHPHARERCA